MVDVSALLLAVEDFIPVILSAVALTVLARLCFEAEPAVGRPAAAAAVLIPIGGLTKPVYKTILAVTDGARDVAVLDDVLFWLLAPGFLLLTAAVRWARRVDGGGTGALGRAVPALGIIVVAIAALLAVIGSEAWFYLLLGVATAGNVLAVIELVRWARARGDTAGAWFYSASVAIVFGLAWAAASLDQTIAVQWGEQLASTASQAMFLAATLRLAAAVRSEAPQSDERRRRRRPFEPVSSSRLPGQPRR